MNGTNPGTGKHGVNRLRDHWHVDGHAITLTHAKTFIGIGQTADMTMQFSIGDFLIHRGIITFKNDGNLITTAFQMTVHAIMANI